jgi:hypothetical protein
LSISRSMAAWKNPQRRLFFRACLAGIKRVFDHSTSSASGVKRGRNGPRLAFRADEYAPGLLQRTLSQS